ncbi:hypothetical protein PENANT_c020G04348 [Penicillium antarcticum]|uniref:F-box domain-containing protein n=1 Tax=Penicillium antarcticum TaxID=416450 RepID=A0A1V6Q0K5_9EURO|nr:uncharacterized protein N7508_004444 [Penicillium antarcticum]KAJ5309065.1 hypothetical protein N7508_004444 [Penicillium antarcticum]OQD82759.1 hypothetical protein PENANT_c020G04348 [Penicillium antarcticum]
MELTPGAKAVSADFKALSHSDRLQAMNAILQSLSNSELREAKDFLDPLKFQKDIWGSLPTELRDIVVTGLELSDIFVLRRVCKSWNEKLSSPALLQTAYLNATASEQPVLDTVSDEHIIKRFKRRIRAEQGRPVTTAQLSVSPNLQDLNGDQISYANGNLARVDMTTAETSICLVHLRTGERRQFTTENRENLRAARVSDTLVAAISLRGICHIWEIMTGVHKSFRLTSLQFNHFLVHGVKVMVSYEDKILHFCFATGVTRTIIVEGRICSASLHKSDDQVSIVCLRDRNAPTAVLNRAGHYLQVEKYTVDGDSFVNTLSRYEQLPFRDDEYERPRPEENFKVSQGQISLRFYPYDAESCPCLYLSLTNDDQIAVHRMPILPGYLQSMNIAWFDQGLVYFTPYQADKHHYAGIGRTRLMNPSFSETLSYEITPVPRLSVLRQPDTVYGIWAGDGFFLYATSERILVWCFDEDWKPSGALSRGPEETLESMRAAHRAQQHQDAE